MPEKGFGATACCHFERTPCSICDSRFHRECRRRKPSPWFRSGRPRQMERFSRVQIFSARFKFLRARLNPAAFQTTKTVPPDARRSFVAICVRKMWFVRLDRYILRANYRWFHRAKTRVTAKASRASDIPTFFPKSVLERWPVNRVGGAPRVAAPSKERWKTCSSFSKELVEAFCASTVPAASAGLFRGLRLCFPHIGDGPW